MTSTWLTRQLDAVAADSETWPAWKKRECNMAIKTVTTKQHVHVCDLCDGQMDVYMWPCYVCEKDVCKNCRLHFRAGLNDNEVRPICSQCAAAVPFPAHDVGLVVRQHKDEVQELREKHQRAIDDIWTKYKETVTCQDSEPPTNSKISEK